MKQINKRLLPIVLAVLLLAQNALAAGVNSVRLNQVQQNGGELTMYVNLMNAAGEPAEGSVSPENFFIDMDGKGLNVDSAAAFNQGAQGIHFVFCVDVSKTMKEQSMMVPLREAMLSFANTLNENDKMSIVTFGVSVDTQVLYSSDKAQIAQTIQNLRADQQMTALYKGVLDGVELASRYGGRSMVIVITDGKNDPTSDMASYTKESIYSEVIAAQVPMYCIGLNDNQGVDEASLLELANATGGEQFVLPGKDVASKLNVISGIARNAIQIKTNIVNDDGKSGFDETSTFKVGYQDQNGNGVVVSNPLQQNINWKSVPTPSPTPTPVPSPTPKPEISLSLSESEIVYQSGSVLTIPGTVEVKQGSINKNDLRILVDDVQWTIDSLSQNGDNYVFTVTGEVYGDVSKLKVQAKLKEDFGSNYAYLSLIKPTAAPTEVPVSISLALSNRSIVYEEGANAVIKGSVTVLGGDVRAEELRLLVNNEEWPAEFVAVSSGFEFSASGELHDISDEYLTVRVCTTDGVATNAAEQPLIIPTAEPTASPTPAPVNEEITGYELDNMDATPIVTEGDKITITGQIDVQGDVKAEELVLLVNDVPYEALIRGDGSGTKFELDAEIEVDSTMLSRGRIETRIQIANTDVYSRTRSIALLTPTATPEPEIEMKLNAAEVSYIAGQDVVISGTITANGDIDMESLNLYVMGAKWEDTSFTRRDDGSFSFEGRSAKVGYDPSNPTMDVKVKLNGVSSNTEMLMLTVTPEPTFTPGPTPTIPVATPQPSTEAVAAESVAPTDTPTPRMQDDFKGWISYKFTELKDSGKIWFVIGAILLLIVAIVVVIVILSKRKKNQDVPVPSENWSTEHNESGDLAGTYRDSDNEEGETIGDQEVKAAAGNGTVRADEFVDEVPAAKEGKFEEGTVRIDDDSDGEAGGTVMLSEDENGIDFSVEVKYKNQQTENRQLFLGSSGEIIGGRSDQTDFVVRDKAVSGRHFSLTYDGEDLYLQDLQSSNGTRIGDRRAPKIEPYSAQKLSDGTSVYIGETVLVFHLNKAAAK